MQMNEIAPMGGHLGGPTGVGSESNHHGTRASGSAATTNGGPTGAVTTLKAGDVFPDLHHKMSKKIAQLTKVIYHLNTKNEDRQASTKRYTMIW